MNFNMTRPAFAFLFLFLIFGSPRSGFSQALPPERKFPLPAPPLLNPAPDFSMWTVTISYPEDRVSKSDKDPAKPLPDYLTLRPRTIITTKTNGLVREEIIDLSSRKTERWHAGNIQFVKKPGSMVWDKVDSTDPEFSSLPPHGFRDLGWVIPENYAGPIKSGTKECLVFVPGGEAALDMKDPRISKTISDAHRLIAFIDAETRFPSAIYMLDEIRSFKWSPPPSSKLSLPDDLADQIKKEADDRARLLQRMPRP